MAQFTGIVTSWDIPNFVGELYTADVTPGAKEVHPSFLTLVGGLNGSNARIVPDMNFNMTVEFGFSCSYAAGIFLRTIRILFSPAPVNPILTPTDNTCQIFMESAAETYTSMSTRGRLVSDQLYPVGAPTEAWMSEFAPSNDASAIARQVTYALQRVARNVNYTFLNGTYVKSTGKGVAARTRGLLKAITTNAIVANGASLSTTLSGS